MRIDNIVCNSDIENLLGTKLATGIINVHIRYICYHSTDVYMHVFVSQLKLYEQCKSTSQLY